MDRTIYEVYEPIDGTTRSRHRTLAAAHRAIVAEQRRLRRQPGMSGSWLYRRIRAVDVNGRRPLTEDELDQVGG